MFYKCKLPQTSLFCITHSKMRNIPILSTLIQIVLTLLLLVALFHYQNIKYSCEWTISKPLFNHTSSFFSFLIKTLCLIRCIPLKHPIYPEVLSVSCLHNPFHQDRQIELWKEFYWALSNQIFPKKKWVSNHINFLIWWLLSHSESRIKPTSSDLGH